MVDCSSCFKPPPFRNIKLHFFLFNGALACVIPYLPVHANEVGISTVSLGVIYCTIPIVTMLLKPFFGAVADHFDNVKSLMFVFLAGIMLSGTLSLSIPRKQKLIASEVRCSQSGTVFHLKVNPIQECRLSELVGAHVQCVMHCSECIQLGNSSSTADKSVCARTESHQADMTAVLGSSGANWRSQFNVTQLRLGERELNTRCAVNLTFTCSAYCDKKVQDCFIGKEEPEYSSDQFCLFLIFATMCVSFMGVATSFTDAICFNNLGDNAHLYGRQRLWGTLGWGLFSPLAGALNDFVTGDSFLRAYQPGSFIQVFILLYDMSVVNRIRTKNTKCSQNVLKDMRRVLGQFRVLAFLCSVLVVGLLTGVLWSYLFLHLGALGATKLVFGIVPAVQCFAGELPFFFFSGWLIARLGHFSIMSICFLTFGVRFIAYSFIRNPWLALPIELLQGPTYGLFYATMASFAHSAALPGTEVTVQGLVGGAFELGTSVGNLLGGILFFKYSGDYMFYYAAYIAFGYTAIHMVLHVAVKILDQKAARRRQEAELADQSHPPQEEQESFM